MCSNNTEVSVKMTDKTLHILKEVSGLKTYCKSDSHIAKNVCVKSIANEHGTLKANREQWKQMRTKSTKTNHFAVILSKSEITTIEYGHSTKWKAKSQCGMKRSITEGYLPIPTTILKSLQSKSSQGFIGFNHQWENLEPNPWQKRHEHLKLWRQNACLV